MCTLTIPTICTIDTVTKVVGNIKQWCDFLANNPVADIPQDQNTKQHHIIIAPFSIVHHQPHRHLPSTWPSLLPTSSPHCHPPCHPPLSTTDSYRCCLGHCPPPLLLQSAATLQHEQQRRRCLSATNAAATAAVASDRQGEGNYGKECQYAVSQ
jgi:hypothetical protein